MIEKYIIPEIKKRLLETSDTDNRNIQTGMNALLGQFSQVAIWNTPLVKVLRQLEQ